MSRRAFATADLAGLMAEAELQRNVIEMARWLGYLVSHQWISIHSAAGAPDLLIAGHGRCLLVELKRQDGKLTSAQAMWRTALEACPLAVEYHCWRPCHWFDGTVERVLRQHEQDGAA